MSTPATVTSDHGHVLTYHAARLSGTPTWECQDCGVYVMAFDSEDLTEHYCGES